MISDGKFSPRPVRADWARPVARRVTPLIAFETGGESRGDPTGIDAYLWTAEYADGVVSMSREGIPSETLFAREGVTRISFTFDLSMQPVVAFDDASGAWLWWFDSVSSEFVFTPVDGRSPFVAIDERRTELSDVSDVILTYLRGTKVYQRAQRDRYTIEYDDQPIGVAITETSRITGFSMNRASRMQWRIKP